MKTQIHTIFIVFSLLLAIPIAQGQYGRVPDAATQAQARKSLASQGVDESELRARLQAKGIDVDNMSPEQLLAARPMIEATVAEIQAENDSSSKGAELDEAESKAVQEGLQKAERIRESVDDGATVQEAAAEAEIAEEAVNDDTGARIYGHEIFKNKTLEVFRGSEQARAPNNYILDSGDELAISIFGASQTDLVLTISDDGFIKPDGIPRIYLKGRTLGEAKRLVRSRLNNYYVFSEGQFTMSVDAARTISVSVYGEVERSGTYTLSALNGALNALVAAGGVTDRGSVRNIELVRDGKRLQIDVYNFLQRPGETTAYGLRDNDIINVPLAEELVEATGAFRRPMVYELLPNEKMSALIAFAGGLTSRAAVSTSKVIRYENGTLSVLDVDATQFESYELRDGDIIEIPVVESPIENFVAIEGAVLVPGRYGFRQNMTVAQLLERAQVRPTARRDVAFLRRKNDDGTNRLLRLDLNEATGTGTLLMRGDQLTVLAANRFVDNANFKVEGAVRDSATTLPYPQEGGLTLEEAILLAGGLESNVVDEAVVIRTPLNNLERKEYLRIALTQATSFQVEPFDRIVLYTQERYADAPTVQIAGAVRNPGSYRYDESLTLNNLLYLAGGARFEAALNRVEIYRLGLTGNETRTLQETVSLDANGTFAGTFELQPYDEVFLRSSANFEAIETITIQGEVRFPGVYARKEGENRLTDYIKRAGGLTEEAFAAGAGLYRPGNEIGYVVLGLDKVIRNPKGPSDIILKGGDTLSIPKPQELVRIETQGTLAAQFGTDSTNADGIIEVAYQGPRDAGWYIDKYAGGFNDNSARKRWTTVELASGQVRETRNYVFNKSYPIVKPGATIRVGIKPPKPPRPERPQSSWGEIAQATVAGLTTLVTLILLVDRI